MVSHKHNLLVIQITCELGYFQYLNEFLSSGGSTLADLQQALEDYLPVLLGLMKDGKSCALFHLIKPDPHV